MSPVQERAGMPKWQSHIGAEEMGSTLGVGLDLSRWEVHSPHKFVETWVGPQLLE